MKLIENKRPCLNMNYSMKEETIDKHCPIIIEQEDFTCAYVAKDLSPDEHSDSFIVVLTNHNDIK